MKSTVLLVILDGWGYRKNTHYNAIHHAHTPVWDQLWSECSHSLLECGGEAVGLPKGQMGNSEVGHMTIGSGRVVYQDLTRIDKHIHSGEFANLATIQSLTQSSSDSTLHLLGLLSPGGVHSHQNHILSMIELAAQHERKVVLHAFLDGRDTPPRSALNYVKDIQSSLETLPNVSIGSIHGRYYAMDRDQRWDRTLASFRLLTQGQSKNSSKSAVEGIEQAYLREESDEFVKPTRIDGTPLISDGDDVFFMNFRADRARQLTQLFTSNIEVPAEYKHSPLVHPNLNQFVCMTHYGNDISSNPAHVKKISVAFDTEEIPDTLAEVVSKKGKTQLRVAETEKYAHVTYFFSGGREELWPGETRHLVPSPRVTTYDKQPEMSAREVTQHLTQTLREGSHDAIIANFANADMVGHTGDYPAALKAVECLDACLDEINKAIMETGSHLAITADHGNVEQMVDERLEQPHTAHTTGRVPFLYKGPKPRVLTPSGGLQDIAPTLLELLSIDHPKTMTGKSLLLQE